MAVALRCMFTQTLSKRCHMPHGKIYNSIVDTCFNTPMVKLRRLAPPNATVLLKCEFFNPMASVKDRIAEAMISDAEKRGIVKNDTHIIEPTSGNTGIEIGRAHV